VPDHVGALRVERANERNDVVGNDGCSICRDATRFVTSAVAAQVRGDDAEALGQRGYLLSPGV
jgi:hypothetical protein